MSGSSFTFTSPEGKKYTVNGPEGATQEQAFQILQSQLKSGTANAKDNYEQATDEMSGLQKFASGFGGGMYGAYLGAKQAGAALANKAGLVSDKTMKDINSDVTDYKQAQNALNKTGAGLTGNVLGGATALAPTALIPGANTLAGAALIGGATGALTTPGDLNERAVSAGLGAAGGAAGQYIGNKVGNYLASRSANNLAQAQSNQTANASKDAILQASKDAGYVVPPTQANPTTLNKVLEGFSGKITTAQVASAKNQSVTNDLARKAIGLAEDTPITKEALSDIRSTAGEAYEAVKSFGTINADKQFSEDLAKITAKYQGAAKDFPELAKNEVADIVNSVNKPQFSADSAVDAMKILRERADKAFNSGDKSLGKAYKSASDAMENVIDRNLESAGKGAENLLQQYRDARTLIAKTYSIQSALNDSTGNVSAAKLASQLEKNKPLSSELKTAAEFANSFPRAAQNIEKIGSQPGISPLDFAVAAMKPQSAGGKTLDFLTLGARPIVRGVITSRPYQNAFVTPSYSNGTINELASQAVNSQIGQNALRLLPQSASVVYAKQK